MRTKNTSDFKRQLEAIESAKAVLLSLMQQIGIRIYREEDLLQLVRTAARDLMDPSSRARARSPRSFGIIDLRRGTLKI